MSKGLEEIKTLRGFNIVELKNDKNINKSLDIIEQVLLELKEIKEANPSEELGLVKRTCEIYVDSLKQRDLIGYDIIEKQINEALDTIKQALLKSQEQEKILKIVFEKEVDIEYIKKEIIFEDYNKWIEFIDSIGINIPKNENRQLTEEEFDLLKRWVE